MLRDPIQVRGDHIPDPLSQIILLLHGVPQHDRQLLHAVEVQSDSDRLLTAEVVIDTSRAGPGSFADLLDGGRFDAMLHETT